MCYTIPGKVKAIQDKTVRVDYFGEEKKAINEFCELEIGDYIYAQGGYVIRKIPPLEAREALEAWKELFFELRELDLRLSAVDLEMESVDKEFAAIVNKALESRPLKEEELLYLFEHSDRKGMELLFRSANFLRQKFLHNSCCVHGILEISNYCAQRCSYCGISHHNVNVSRYRMTQEEIVDAATQAIEDYGFQTLVLQSGEDPHFTVDELADTIRRIRLKNPVLIFVSFGEVGIDGLETLYKAGARGLLLRFETSNPDLYRQLHPGRDLETRLHHIREAYRMGYLIITGGLIGLPNQTDADLIRDIYLAKGLHTEMYSFGPFLPSPDTPLAAHQPPRVERVLKVLALARFVDAENAKILVTSAFETLDRDARRRGLLSGANSVMLNVTPVQYRKHYSLYPNRIYNTEEIETQIDQTLSLLKSLGRAPTELGAARNHTM